MKLAFIVQRYGKEILGGSEALARQLAERLSRRHEVTVLTTTAKDYITWKNEYEPGEEKVRGVRVMRFPVEGERNLEEFNKFSEEVYKGQTTKEQELEWIQRQGPVTPALVDYLKKEHERFDLVVFFTYLYYPTYYGLQVAPEKSILVPTAHDEPPLRLGIFREMFQLPSSFVFNTEAEEVLVLERFPVHKKMRETIGMGMELLDQPDVHSFRRKHDIPGKYLLYAGRIDAGKGMEELFRYFDFYKEEHPGSGNLQLILIGRLGMKLPASSSIRYIGFVDEGDKLSAMAGAVAVVQPSRMESLSIVTLEAFSVGTPVIVTAASRVLIDHCRRANAGLYYGDFEEFEEVLSLLLTDRNLGRSLGRNGQTYVKENYGWNKVLAKYELVFRSSARPAKEPRGSRSRPVSSTVPERAEPSSPREVERAEDRGAEAHEPPESEEMLEGEEEEYVSTDELPLLEPEGALAEAEERAYRERDEREQEESSGSERAVRESESTLGSDEPDEEERDSVEGRRDLYDTEAEAEADVEELEERAQGLEPEREAIDDFVAEDEQEEPEPEDEVGMSPDLEESEDEGEEEEEEEGEGRKAKRKRKAKRRGRSPRKSLTSRASIVRRVVPVLPRDPRSGGSTSRRAHLPKRIRRTRARRSRKRPRTNPPARRRLREREVFPSSTVPVRDRRRTRTTVSDVGSG